MPCVTAKALKKKKLTKPSSKFPVDWIITQKADGLKYEIVTLLTNDEKPLAIVRRALISADNGRSYYWALLTRRGFEHLVVNGYASDQTTAMLMATLHAANEGYLQ